MFTGIIQEMGKIVDLRGTGGGLRMTVHASISVPSLGVGDSVAINGVCQTVVAIDESTFAVESVEETLAKTTLGELSQGDHVNLETAARLGDPMGGHLVQGHVDGVGSVTAVSRLGSSWLMEIEIPDQLRRYVVPVGSIAIDGVSLTVARLAGNMVTIAVIPHTLEHTTLGQAIRGKRVNIECDLIGKYVEALVRPYGGTSLEGQITRDNLAKWGYETGST